MSDTSSVHLPVRPEWLALRQEAAIEPDLPIVDPHHHFWMRDGAQYSVPEYLADIAGNNVRATVFIECREHYRTDGDEDFQPVGETEFVVGTAGSQRGADASDTLRGPPESTIPTGLRARISSIGVL